jgi:hypothetical protein
VKQPLASNPDQIAQTRTASSVSAKAAEVAARWEWPLQAGHFYLEWFHDPQAAVAAAPCFDSDTNKMCESPLPASDRPSVPLSSGYGLHHTRCCLEWHPQNQPCAVRMGQVPSWSEFG